VESEQNLPLFRGPIIQRREHSVIGKTLCGEAEEGNAGVLLHCTGCRRRGCAEQGRESVEEAVPLRGTWVYKKKSKWCWAAHQRVRDCQADATKVRRGPRKNSQKAQRRVLLPAPVEKVNAEEIQMGMGARQA